MDDPSSDHTQQRSNRSPKPEERSTENVENATRSSSKRQIHISSSSSRNKVGWMESLEDRIQRKVLSDMRDQQKRSQSARTPKERPKAKGPVPTRSLRMMEDMIERSLQVNEGKPPPPEEPQQRRAPQPPASPFSPPQQTLRRGNSVRVKLQLSGGGEKETTTAADKSVGKLTARSLNNLNRMEEDMLAKSKAAWPQQAQIQGEDNLAKARSTGQSKTRTNLSRMEEDMLQKSRGARPQQENGGAASTSRIDRLTALEAKSTGQLSGRSSLNQMEADTLQKSKAAWPQQQQRAASARASGGMEVRKLSPARMRQQSASAAKLNNMEADVLRKMSPPRSRQQSASVSKLNNMEADVLRKMSPPRSRQQSASASKLNTMEADLLRKSPPRSRQQSARATQLSDMEANVLRKMNPPKPRQQSTRAATQFKSSEDDVFMQSGLAAPSTDLLSAPSGFDQMEADVGRKSGLPYASAAAATATDPSSHAGNTMQQLNRLEDDLLIKGNMSQLDKTRVLEGRNEHRQHQEMHESFTNEDLENDPPPQGLNRANPLRSFVQRVTKSVAVPTGALGPGAYRAGVFNADDESEEAMTNSDRLLYQTDSEQDFQTAESVARRPDPLDEDSKSNISSSMSRSYSRQIGLDPSPRELSVDYEEETADQTIEVKQDSPFRPWLILILALAIIGAAMGLAVGLLSTNSSKDTIETPDSSEPQADTQRDGCVVDLKLEEQCQLSGRVDNIPSCVRQRYGDVVREVGVATGESMHACSSANLAMLFMAATEQDLYLSNYVLSALFLSTKGPTSWKTIGGWATSSDVCSWQGVKCNLMCGDSGGDEEDCVPDPEQVVEITLEGVGLEGTLPGDISLLSTLQTIKLAGNLLEGKLATEFGDLWNLETLDLSHNAGISGTIPSAFASLNRLRELSLEVTKLSGRIPTEVGLMTSLEVFDLSSNLLDGSVPSEVGLLGNLRRFEIDANLLEGDIPTELGHCIKLETLLGFNNQFRGTIPSEMGMLSQLSKCTKTVQLYGTLREALN